jgi:hypothetical protein
MMRTIALSKKLLQSALGGCKLQATRNSGQETLNAKSETRNLKLETRNSKPVTTTWTYNSFPCNENNDAPQPASFLFGENKKLMCL